MSELREQLTRFLRERYPTAILAPGSDPHLVATFKGPIEVGDLCIWDDGDEATVALGKITHTHFNPDDSELSKSDAARKICDELKTFLEELFSNKVLFWKETNGGGGMMRFDEPPNASSSIGRDYFTWAGRYTPNG